MRVVTRGLGGPPRRTDDASVAGRARRLAAGPAGMGIRPGDRVATLCMNHVRHLEAHFGVPAMGAILHTLNPRLHADDLGLIVRDAGDRAIVVDALPRTATGTSKKAELRAQFGSAPG